jgi:hypothetical protein
MPDSVTRRPRLIALILGIVATAAISAMLFGGLGFRRSLTVLQQLSLLLAVAVLWAVHIPLHFGSRYWSRRPAATRKITQSFKSRKS